MGKNNKGRKNISAPVKKQGALIKAIEPASTESDPVVFSFERIQSGKYCFSSLDAPHKIAVAESIFRRRSLRWSDAWGAGRHGLGLEKIGCDAIAGATIPKFITADKATLLVFRYNGLAPMVGYRISQIFYVLWFDHDFTLYDHGS
ncbi:MAG: hypothetical protein P1U67_11655 [Alcanivoracaceae bacterium]|nr:hypothetical protein [Alcanivoracaceae bacterium]